MNKVLVVLVCLIAPLCAAAQSNGDEEGSPVARLTLAKEAKDGTIVEAPESFGISDVPIICYVDLESGDPVEVKAVMVAVKAVGVRPNSAYITVRFKTEPGVVNLNFKFEPKDKWPPGDYRIDVYVAGSKGGSRGFRISK